MSINLSAPQLTELKPRIVVVGIGGAGGNAVNNMILTGLGGVEFIVANTDAQALSLSQADRKIQLGVSITQGLGCGAQPEVGRAAAEEAIEQIMDHMQGAHMVFITAGMGGGTGTGGAPVVAQACREFGILTVGVVTKPFHFEGSHRMQLAENGIAELQSYVDTQIIIPNQNLFRVANEKTTFADAFAMADQVLNSGVRGITDLMVMPGLINLDFADVKTVMNEMGKAMMGTGEAEGEKRAIDAAEAAISNPLLDDVSMSGARGLLINITGGLDLTLYEVDEAANRIREEVDPNANIIVGSALDDSLSGRMRVSVVATGIDVDAMAETQPITPPRLYAVGGRVETRPEATDGAATVSEAAPIEPPTTAAQPPDTVAQGRRALNRLSFGRAAPTSEAVATAAAAPHPAPAEASAPLFSRMGSAMPERVPLAKPLAPEPAPMPQKPVVQEQIDDAPFIAPEPVEPKLPPASLPRAEPIVGPADTGISGNEPRRSSRGFSLFRRMTAGVRSDEAAMEATAPSRAALPERAEPRITETAAVPPPSEPAPEPDLEFKDETQVQAEPQPEPQPEPVEAEDGATNLTPQEQDDLLEIPSFLRRQAN